jgi:hypothetical protein
MIYKIEISGRGGEAFIWKISDEQFKTLNEEGVTDDKMDHDRIGRVLETESLFDTDEIVFGLYNNGEYFIITVKDESGNIVWESLNDFQFEFTSVNSINEEVNYFIAEDYQKGQFFEYEFETESEFNPQLLGCEITELLGGELEYITSLSYNFEKLDNIGELDTSSKGFTYYLENR